MVDRSVRSLEHLETSASTARVLNLRMVAKRKSNDPEYNAHPVFKNASLNTSIIVKHRLRPNELEQFPTPRRIATKILVPIETNDLRLGARYVFIGQRRFEQSLYEAFGIAIGGDSPDLRTLAILDETPTLDPFLLREQLRRNGLEPARCYFELSQADTQRMFDFAQREIEPLVRMSVGSDAAAHVHAVKLTRKILANSADADLEPLRQTMQLDRQQVPGGRLLLEGLSLLQMAAGRPAAQGVAGLEGDRDHPAARAAEPGHPHLSEGGARDPAQGADRIVPGGEDDT